MTKAQASDTPHQTRTKKNLKTKTLNPKSRQKMLILEVRSLSKPYFVGLPTTPPTTPLPYPPYGSPFCGSFKAPLGLSLTNLVTLRAPHRFPNFLLACFGRLPGGPEILNPCRGIRNISMVKNIKHAIY